MPWPDNSRGRARCRPGLGQYYTATNGTTDNGGAAILPDAGDRQYRARSRLADEHRRLAYARLAHQAMPLTRYYGPRPLRDVPLGQFLVEGWWAA